MLKLNKQVDKDMELLAIHLEKERIKKRKEELQAIQLKMEELI